MNKTIAIIKGDGIGPEIVTEAMGILDAVAAKFGHTFTYVDAPMGGNAIDKFGVPLPDSSLATCRGADSVLLGAVGGPKWDDQPAANRPERGLLKLREGMVGAPIVLLSEPPATAAPLLLAYKIMPSIYTPEFAIAYAEKADEYGIRAPFHLAVNTGMNRIGVRYDNVVDFMRKVSFHRALDLVGTFTHFATADCEGTLDFGIQVKRFTEAISALREVGIDPGIVHCANSAATVRYPQVHFDMVRWGVSLYGLHTCQETRSMINLKPAMSVHARITDARTLPMSEGVSYGLHYRSTGSVKICTLPIGYADGYNRALSSRAQVIYNGQLCNQVGNICMDQCMFEIDMRSRGTRSRLDPQIGDEVLLVGAQGGARISIDDMAEQIGTIPHELCCAFGLRMPKVYTR